MTFAYCCKSDIGTTRESNQDCAYAGVIKTSLGEAFLGVVCDGMGGLSKGAFASKMVTETFQNWFENDMLASVDSEFFVNIVFNQWMALVEKTNNALIEMAQNFGEQMGTTLSALLLLNGKYYAVQVGDSRIYRCSGNTLTQITTDHSYVMEMVSKGMMTESEARLSRRRNVLTRCIGVVKNSFGDFFNGVFQNGDSFLISSDGFHGSASEENIREILKNLTIHKHREAERRINKYIDARKKSGEKDNITALIVITK